jgi:uncharacterized protein
MMARFLLTLFLLTGIGGVTVCAQEKLPPAPQHYVSDEAGVLSPTIVATLNQQLGAFEKATSNQIVVAVYPTLPEGASLEDYTQRLYTAWHIGQKKTSNGVLIVVFVQDHKVRIQPGYGLEGALPDALCAQIIRQTMAPAFRAGNYGGGLSAGINAIMKASKGEYQGNGRTGGKPTTLKDILFSPLGFFFLVMLILIIFSRGQRGGGGSSGGSGISPGAAAATGFFLGGGGWGGGGGSGGGSGDGGGFSGGGGERGGGGASGGW